MNKKSKWKDRRKLLDVLDRCSTSENYPAKIARGLMTPEATSRYLGRIKEEGLVTSKKEKYLNITRYGLTEKGKKVRIQLKRLRQIRLDKSDVCNVLDKLEE